MKAPQKQHRKAQTTKIRRPFTSVDDFVLNFKPISKLIDIGKLRATQDIKFVEDDKGYYYGEVVNQVRFGVGVFFGHDGSVYEGLWSNGKRNGKGFEKYQNGSFFQGDFCNDKPHGNGIMLDINSETYDGQWYNGKKQGTGAWKTAKGFNYIGEWKNNKMEGYGVLNDSNGDKYEGLFRNDKKNGKGVLKYRSGDLYKGYFQDGELHGFGEYYWANGNSYRGEFKKGKSDGPGLLKYKFPKQKSYEGYFRENMKWGYGVYTWSSGSCYKGFFERDVKNGYGQMFWPDGNIYRGWWKDGVQHGKGELFVENQGLMKGIFNKNHLAVLTQHKAITRAQYEDMHSNNPEKNLPEGLGRKNKTSKKKDHRKYKNKMDTSPSYSPKKFKYKKSIAVGSLDTIEFPLLFHHHSRLKTEQLPDRYDDQATNREKDRKLLSLELGCSRQKNLHSALGIHKRYLKTYKNSESTMADYTINQKISLYNAHTKYPKI